MAKKRVKRAASGVPSGFDKPFALSTTLPLMLGGGVGSELRNPLGLTMVGGLIVSQMLTLFTTPVIYLYLDRLRQILAVRHSSMRWRPGFLVPGGPPM